MARMSRPIRCLGLSVNRGDGGNYYILVYHALPTLTTLSTLPGHTKIPIMAKSRRTNIREQYQPLEKLWGAKVYQDVTGLVLVRGGARDAEWLTLQLTYGCRLWLVVHTSCPIQLLHLFFCGAPCGNPVCTALAEAKAGIAIPPLPAECPVSAATTDQGLR
jgi:hypothetical protein